jgi:hypothetical protein
MAMKVNRLTILAAIILVAPASAFGQQKVNTMHGAPSGTMAAKPLATVIPQLAGKWDILSTDAGGDPYNSSGGVYFGPIEFTADFTQTDVVLTQVQGFTFTSSACSADGTASVTGTMSPDGNKGNADVVFTATVDQGYVYQFRGNYKKHTPGEISGTWTSTGGACGLQNGQFTAYQYNQLSNSSFAGEFTSDVNGSQANGVTVNVKEANNFTVSGSMSGPANACFNGLTIDSTQSFASGGNVEFFATNAQGAQVGFIASNTNATYQQLPNDQPHETSLYITYSVYQSGGGCQAGDSGHDAVFELVNPKPVKQPVHPPHSKR